MRVSLLLALLCALCACVQASLVVPMYRLAHHDTTVRAAGSEEAFDADGDDGLGAGGDDEDGEQAAASRAADEWVRVGSRSSAVNLQLSAAHPSQDDARGRGQLLNRRVAVVKVADTDLARLEALADGRQAGAVLIILPSQDDVANPPAESLQAWQALEQSVLSRPWPLPIYFAFPTPELESVYASLYSSLSGDQYTLMAGTPSTKVLPSVPARNLQGLLTGAGGDTVTSTPTVAIVAHYDTFSAVPGIAAGADSNGSGVIAVLQLARLFARLYADASSHSDMNMLFLLTGAGKFGYAGAQEWLASAKNTLVSSLSLVVCIDSIGAADTLFLHKPDVKSDAVKGIVRAFGAVAPRFGKKVKTVTSAVSTPPAWEHERFMRERIPAVTVSGVAKATSARRSSFLDTSVDAAALATNIQVIAEAVAKFVYRFDGNGVQVFSSDPKVHVEDVAAWVAALGRASRYQPLVDVNGELVTGLRDYLATYTTANTSDFTIGNDGQYRFYSAVSGPGSVYLVKPITFDLMVLLASLAYLFVLFVLLKGRGAFAAIKSVFAPAKSKRV